MTEIEKEIVDVGKIDRILEKAKICRIALIDGDFPYILPMFFGYSITGGKLELYFRCEEKGKKIDIIKQNSNAAFEVENFIEIIPGKTPVDFVGVYQSITGTGTIEVITGIDKITGLSLIIKKYDESGQSKECSLSEQMLNSFAVLKLTADEFCCKEHNVE